VLSGFLITSLLLDEHAASGSVDLGALYRRRLRRLGPPAAIFIAAWVGVELLSAGWLAAAAGIAGTLLAAELSWRLVERRLVRAPGFVHRRWAIQSRPSAWDGTG